MHRDALSFLARTAKQCETDCAAKKRRKEQAMKKTYATPELEVVNFAVSDIITTSGFEDNDENATDPA